MVLVSQYEEESGQGSQGRAPQRKGTEAEELRDEEELARRRGKLGGGGEITHVKAQRWKELGRVEVR